MHWYDHFAILCALVLALWADYDAGVALRASIVNYLSTVVEGEGDEEEIAWIRAADLRKMFGPSVYKHLHKLMDEGVIERQETPGGPKRGRRPDYSYRWRVE